MTFTFYEKINNEKFLEIQSTTVKLPSDTTIHLGNLLTDSVIMRIITSNDPSIALDLYDSSGSILDTSGNIFADISGNSYTTTIDQVKKVFLCPEFTKLTNTSSVEQAIDIYYVKTLKTFPNPTYVYTNLYIKNTSGVVTNYYFSKTDGYSLDIGVFPKIYTYTTRIATVKNKIEHHTQQFNIYVDPTFAVSGLTNIKFNLPKGSAPLELKLDVNGTTIIDTTSLPLTKIDKYSLLNWLQTTGSNCININGTTVLTIIFDRSVGLDNASFDYDIVAINNYP